MEGQCLPVYLEEMEVDPELMVFQDWLMQMPHLDYAQLGLPEEAAEALLLGMLVLVEPEGFLLLEGAEEVLVVLRQGHQDLVERELLEWQ